MRCSSPRFSEKEPQLCPKNMGKKDRVSSAIASTNITTKNNKLPPRKQQSSNPSTNLPLSSQNRGKVLCKDDGSNKRDFQKESSSDTYNFVSTLGYLKDDGSEKEAKDGDELEEPK